MALPRSRQWRWLHFSNDYGYGGVDAYNAVRMAEVWSFFAAPQISANETSISASMAAPEMIKDLTHTDLKSCSPRRISTSTT